MRRILGSVRVRITVVATLIFAVAFVLASVLLVRAVRGSMEDRLRDNVVAVTNEATEQLDAGVPPDEVVTPGGSFILLIREKQTGRVLRTQGVPAGETFSDPLIGLPIQGHTVIQESNGKFIATQNVPGPEGGLEVVAASPLDEIRRNVDSLVGGLWLGIPALIGLVGLLVWWLVGRSLRPVAAIRAEVDEISHGTLHRRVPVPPSDDEVAHLAGTMNAMLDRLERSSTQQREFVSDASHELRSPIASIKATLEVALRHQDRADWEHVAREVLAEDERMERVVADLLDLARVEENGDALTDAPVVDLDDAVLEEVARVRDRRVDAGQVSAGRVRGRRNQLARAVRNLLENAEHHAAEKIDVSLVSTDGVVELMVEDDGPGIAAADRERVFERFTRLDEGRDRDAGGAGLGLAMARAIVERHGGTVDIESGRLGGARFVVRLPAGETVSRHAGPP